ncbi:MAG: vWA domain-containing protein, partial [Planctomycetota bacterium]
GRTLVVTDPQGDTRDWNTLVKALERAGLAVELKTAYEFPREALSLMPYDCIIFPNVPADVFDVVQLQAVRDAVYSQGIGFLMVGGDNSYGPGGYHRSPVEEALPVTMDITQKKVLPKGALAIVLHTCEFAEGNTWGKRIAKEAIRVLGAEDEVGVLIFGWGGGQSGYTWRFKLTRAGDYEKLVPLINKAQIGDMPDFGSTMTMGLAGLKASDAAMKHMIIISDGDPQPPTPALIEEFVLNKISVTTVAINPHGGQEVAVMRTIAGVTGGRYYFPKDPKKLPSIFIKEAKTLRRSMIQNKTFTPTVEFPSPILKGIDACPELYGYVLTTAKPRSTTILRGPETEQLDPVLATWRHGLGKSAAFTSDLSPNWAKSWVEWGHFQAFVKQLVTDISRVEKKTFLRMRTAASGTTGVVTIEDYNPEGSFLEVEGRVSGPRGRSVPVRLRQVGARRYRGKFSLWGKGRYQVQAMGAGDGRSETAMSGFAVPYSPEYLRFRSDPIVLGKVAAKTGGRILRGDETGKELFGKDRKPKESSRSVEDIFLIILACLVPLDVGLRRIQIDWQLIKGWIGLGRKGPSDKTLGALLRVKRRMKAAAGEKEEAMPLPARLRAAAVKPPPGEVPAAGKTSAPAKKPKPAETTARLLALKRKREREKGGEK